MRKFHDNGHANNRLSRCLIGYTQGAVKKVSKCVRATLTHMELNDGTEVALNDPMVEITFDGMLGYVNTKHQCMYVTRRSRRMWKAGLVPDNLNRMPLYRDFFGMADDMGPEKMMLALYKGVYPTYESALTRVSKGTRAAQAFSRKFAWGLHKSTKATALYYKNKPIGYWSDDYEGVVIPDVNSHLIQQLNEVAPTLKVIV